MPSIDGDMGVSFGQDGWTLRWDLTATPQGITAIDAQGVQQWHLSGAITPQRLARELAAFEREHNQPRLLRMEDTA